jgi:hypothetical protein
MSKASDRAGEIFGALMFILLLAGGIFYFKDNFASWMPSISFKGKPHWVFLRRRDGSFSSYINATVRREAEAVIITGELIGYQDGQKTFVFPWSQVECVEERN